MRRRCERNKRVRLLLAIACGAACMALLLYCVPWWIFLVIGIAALLLAGWKLFSN